MDQGYENRINALEAVKPLSDAQGALIREMLDAMVIYNSAIKEVSTKLEILNDEFHFKNQRNPIEHIKSRVKTPASIFEKLRRKGLEVSVSSARKNLTDIAGIRVICPFIEDIYTVASLLQSQNDVKLIEVKDYIKNPKPNGYRSLHLIVEIPVFFSTNVEHVSVEVQIRTIAMDFWASLEHQLYYKSSAKTSSLNIREELKKCAEVIADTDIKMYKIHKMILESELEEE